MGAMPDLWLGLQSPPLTVAGRAAEPMQPNEIKSPSHLIVLKAISLAFGAVSLLSASVTLYCLIILLILGDFMKSLWFVIFPIQSFASGNEDPSYAFCQASGYGLALGIEAADCAVFLIAIHFAMSIFRRQQSRSGCGLEPYRFYVYAFWVGFPILMASLIFVDCNRGYGNFGQYCYVPNRPTWCRLPASSGSNLAGSLPSEWHLDRLGDVAIPTVDTLNQGPADIHVTATPQPEAMQAPLPAHTRVRNHEPQSDLQTKARSLTCQSAAQFLWEICSGMVKSLGRLRPSTTSTYVQNKLCHNQSQPNGKGEGEVISASMSSSAYISSGSNPETNTSIEQAHQRIRRQLRLLFVYPLVYLTIWVCPFILHLVRLRTDIKDPFPLLVLTMLSLCAAGSVDSAIFMARERPWRFVHAGFWKSLCRRLHISWRTSAQFQGLSREEMIANAMMAHERRQEEVALESIERRATAERSARGRRKVAENWWDLADE
ncbi:plasma membrane g- coupled receptor [Trichoderma arundinaceum]|uniref:Plasma membrane g-coupled receptor n=1 Tax=Trichoderma arundinaceum TaxID=490622 RepID=A0A395NB02_TRIAR|nr:plasma membrane g- coupled receptor [Trichoderma arundinaceum]